MRVEATEADPASATPLDRQQRRMATRMVLTGNGRVAVRRWRHAARPARRRRRVSDGAGRPHLPARREVNRWTARPRPTHCYSVDWG